MANTNSPQVITAAQLTALSERMAERARKTADNDIAMCARLVLHLVHVGYIKTSVAVPPIPSSDSSLPEVSHASSVSA